MSAQHLSPEDVLMSATQKPAVVVQVDELAVTSPTAEITSVLSRTVEVGKATIDEDHNIEFFSVPVMRSRTNEMRRREEQSDTPTAHAFRSSSHEMLCRQKTASSDDYFDVSSKRRAHQMQLPSFKSLGIAPSDSGEYLGLLSRSTDGQSGPSTRPATGRAAAQSLPLPTSENVHPSRQNFGSTPLLTPPEDADSIKWNNALLHQSVTGGESSGISRTVPQTVASGGDGQQDEAETLIPSQSPDGESSGEQTQAGSSTSDHNVQMGNGGTSLARAIQPLISRVVGAEAHAGNISIIAQILPQPAVETTHSKPAFEEVVEAIQAQQSSHEIAYITMTHAVPPKFQLKDLPTSPPSTPNLAHGRDDYFGQTIFSTAATVSTYHGHKSLLNHQAPASPNTIVAPSTIQISVLERYIPPTSAQEYRDFFDSRSHSILVDRLAELSVGGGRLLLLYPTKTGGETFMDSYLGPVMDPFLREFIFLNNLYFQLGTTLGGMSAVSSMLEYEDMEHRIRSLCRSISTKGSLRGGPASHFNLIYSDRGTGAIDSKTWKEWYVQQELLRIKENLVEYHKNGGRMPPEVNHREITTGVLARQVVDGITDSSRVSGGVPIELGIFVIERSKA